MFNPLFRQEWLNQIKHTSELTENDRFLALALAIILLNIPQ